MSPLMPTLSPTRQGIEEYDNLKIQTEASVIALCTRSCILLNLLFRKCMFIFGRTARNLRDYLSYPYWIISGKPAPDNHIYKRKRILKIAKAWCCVNFIETGTFYGQMIDALKRDFKTLLSVELFEPLYKLNKIAFQNYSSILLYYGNSSTKLKDMLNDSQGNSIFWLDGHYSGEGTACGEQVSPILGELEIIASQRCTTHCILIDDARLFTGSDGYPTLEETKEKLLTINPNYRIYLDLDCIVAVPNSSTPCVAG